MRSAIAVLACVGIMLTVTGGGSATRDRRLTGSPDRGEAVFVGNGCGFCHTSSKAGSSGSTAPDLDWSLRADAARARMPIGRFALSRLVWGGRSMPSFRTTLSSQELEDVVSFLVGRPFTAPPGDVPQAPLLPAPLFPAAQPALVARWRQVSHLPRTAVPGAKLFAKVACLSCHTYLGAGTRSLGGRDLTRIGATRRGTAFFEAYLRNPRSRGNARMPPYAALGSVNLEQIAIFLDASRGQLG
jgi:mono/diheme cytochrome c family protein